jgi:hypothetical protein
MYFIMLSERKFVLIGRSPNTSSGSGGSSSNSEDTVNRQNEISGERKEVNVEDMVKHHP